MKVKEIRLNKFKRFSDLTISDIPEAAKLVLLVGPNGSGKTSLFEAFNHWYNLKGFNTAGQPEYFLKKEDATKPADNWYANRVVVNFHGDTQLDRDATKGKFYFRTAYRNEPDFTFSQLTKQADPTQSVKLRTLMLNDQTVSENYQRLVANTLSGVYSNKNNHKTVEALREELIGRIRTALSNIFDDLTLDSIGDPLSSGSFFFTKGNSTEFHYKNLSAGEKSVFDLVLDILIKSTFYTDAVFCIDEPEAHMHTELQSKLLRELYNLTPDGSQLWISTHSIGMLREAKDIAHTNPGTVVFLDFGNRDFDLTENIVPAPIDKSLWDKFVELAFADFSRLIAPERIVFCEGDPRGRKYKDFDAQILNILFGNKHHSTRFVSVGSSTELENADNPSLTIISKILGSCEILKLVDRDSRSQSEIEELRARGIKTTKRRHIESYLFDDEIITKLCAAKGKPEATGSCLAAKKEAIRRSIGRQNPADDLKSASGEIFTSISRELGITDGGNNKCAFMRDTLAPLITEDTQVFSELEKEIFE